MVLLGQLVSHIHSAYYKVMAARMRDGLLLVAVMAALIGLGWQEQSTKNREVITLAYAPGRSCARCYGMTITVQPDGRVLIEHRRRLSGTAAVVLTGHNHTIPLAAVARFQQQLNALRPHGRLPLNGQPECQTVWTDTAQIVVTWRFSGGRDVLLFDLGCDRDRHAGWRRTLLTAHHTLGIRDQALPSLEPDLP